MHWRMHNGQQPEVLGFIPQFLSDFDPRPAAEQFDEAYAHGGGWHSFGKGKWKLSLADSAMSGLYGASTLRYPGDSAFRIIAHTILHEVNPNPMYEGKPIRQDELSPNPELILVFNGGPWVVIKPLNSDDFDVARMD